MFCSWWRFFVNTTFNKNFSNKFQWNVTLQRQLACRVLFEASFSLHRFCATPLHCIHTHSHLHTHGHTYKHRHTQTQQVRDYRSRSRHCPICILNAFSQPTTVFTVQCRTTNLHTLRCVSGFSRDSEGGWKDEDADMKSGDEWNQARQDQRLLLHITLNEPCWSKVEHISKQDAKDEGRWSSFQ